MAISPHIDARLLTDSDSDLMDLGTFDSTVLSASISALSRSSEIKLVLIPTMNWLF